MSHLPGSSVSAARSQQLFDALLVFVLWNPRRQLLEKVQGFKSMYFSCITLFLGRCKEAPHPEIQVGALQFVGCEAKQRAELSGSFSDMPIQHLNPCPCDMNVEKNLTELHFFC